jgi:hypothetical protein
MMRFEPRMHIDAETAGLIENTTLPLLESPTVIVTDAYPFALAAEIVGDEVQVRAATGDELTAFLTVGDAPNPDDFEWPGDPALPAGREIAWQEKQDSEIELDRACHLWCGEVILNSGSGTSGPFYMHEQAARSWAFSTALTLPEQNIWELQVGAYDCVRRFAPNLISLGKTEFKRLNKFWVSPVRSAGRVESFSPPGPGRLAWQPGPVRSAT